MRAPEFLKIDIDLVDGMKDRVAQQHAEGESYAEMYAENFNEWMDFAADVDQECLPFQRKVAFAFAVTVSIVDEYMKSHGWNLVDGKWVQKPELKNVLKETKSDLTDNKE